MKCGRWGKAVAIPLWRLVQGPRVRLQLCGTHLQACVLTLCTSWDPSSSHSYWIPVFSVSPFWAKPVHMDLGRAPASVGYLCYQVWDTQGLQFVLTLSHLMLGCQPCSLMVTLGPWAETEPMAFHRVSLLPQHLQLCWVVFLVNLFFPNLVVFLLPWLKLNWYSSLTTRHDANGTDLWSLMVIRNWDGISNWNYSWSNVLFNNFNHFS